MLTRNSRRSSDQSTNSVLLAGEMPPRNVMGAQKAEQEEAKLAEASEACLRAHKDTTMSVQTTRFAHVSSPRCSDTLIVWCGLTLGARSLSHVAAPCTLAAERAHGQCRTRARHRSLRPAIARSHVAAPCTLATERAHGQCRTRARHRSLRHALARSLARSLSHVAALLPSERVARDERERNTARCAMRSFAIARCRAAAERTRSQR